MKKFELPPLPYDKSALKPFLSEETFDFHHGKHHAAYITNLNNLIKDNPYADKYLEAIIKDSWAEKNSPIFNNAAQHWNHSFFWNCMSPNGGGAPKGKILELIEKNFGSYESFKEQFTRSAVSLFGSGWCWLVLNNSKLEILSMPNAEIPIVADKNPLLVIDVWEHAYYIDYRNVRASFVEKFWDVANWDYVNSLL